MLDRFGGIYIYIYQGLKKVGVGGCGGGGCTVGDCSPCPNVNLGIIGMKMVVLFMSTLEIIALSGVVHRVKNTAPRIEPCGTPYESVTLSGSVFIFYGFVPILQVRKQKLSLSRYSIPI